MIMNLFLKEYESRFNYFSEKQIDEINSYINLTNSKYFTFSINKGFIKSDKVYGTITAKSYIGLFKISNNISIIIRPKIDSADFINILRYIDNKKIDTWKNLLQNIDREENFIDFFITEFLKNTIKVLNENQRKGYNKKYVRSKQYKGKFIKFIQKPILPRLMEFQIFEFNFNTIYNQIIKFTLLQINSLISPSNHKRYVQLLNFLTDVDFKGFRIRDFGSLTYDRNNYFYKEIHEMCELILLKFSVKFEQGNNQFFAFTLNSWNIYEVFLREIIRLYQKDFQIFSYTLKEINQEKDRSEKKQYPDIICLNKEKRLYIDAKYKFETNTHDRYQMVNYLAQDELKYGILIYPLSNSKQNSKSIGKTVFVRNIFINLKNTGDRDYLKSFVTDIFNKFQKDMVEIQKKLKK